MKRIIAVLAIAVSAWAQNPETAAFPTTVVTDTTLPVAMPQPSSARTLVGSISSGATSFVLSSGTGVIVPSYWTIQDTASGTTGREVFLCTAFSSPTLSSCTGHQDGTSAQSHANGSYVYNFLGATQWNKVTAEIKAVETALAARKLNYIAGGGTAQAQTATMVPPVASLANGLSLCWLPAAANTGAAPTLAVNGLTAKPITKTGTTALVANDLTTSAIACAIYDGTEFQLQNPQTSSGGSVSSVYGLTGTVNPKVDEHDAANFCSDAGSTDTYACNLSPAATAYVTGTHYRFKANTLNTGAASINFNSLGAKTIVKVAGGITTALATNDILAGQWVDLVYDGTNMQMQSLLGNAPGAGSTNSVFTGSTATAPSHSATPTFSLADVSVKSPMRIEPGAMTANVTSVTFTNKSAGAKFSIAWTQDGTGGRTVSYGASATNACAVDPTASATTTQFFEVGSDGSTVYGVGCTTTASTFGGPEQAAPGTPASSTAVCWFDSTNHILSCKNNNSATVSSAVVPSTCSSQFVRAVSAAGVITCATVSGSDIASSAALAGSPTTTTQSAGDNSTKIATTAYVDRMKQRAIAFTIGDPGNSSALTAASTTTSYVTVPFACTIAAYSLLIDAGTITVKFWKIATGTAIPTSSNSINTSGVAISSGTAIRSATVSDFTTTTVTANDILAMNVTSVATAKFVTGVLECNQ